MSDTEHIIDNPHNISDAIGQNDLQSYDIDTLIHKAGGFGRIQWLIMIFGIIADQGLNFFLWNIAYLELVPSILCKYTETSTFVKCHDYKDICIKDKVYEWKVDYSDPYSFHNWMTDQQLYCKSDFAIGMFGSMFFMGFGFLGVFLKFSDKFGRRNIIISSCIFQTVIVLLFLFANDYRVYYVVFFFAGISVTKETVLFIYRLE